MSIFEVKVRVGLFYFFIRLLFFIMRASVCAVIGAEKERGGGEKGSVDYVGTRVWQQKRGEELVGAVSLCFLR